MQRRGRAKEVADQHEALRRETSSTLLSRVFVIEARRHFW